MYESATWAPGPITVGPTITLLDTNAVSWISTRPSIRLPLFRGHVHSAGRAVTVALKASGDHALALAHLVQVIGEAARRVSPEFCDAHPEIPWKAIVGMRHKVVHDYMDVDEDIAGLAQQLHRH